MFTSNNLTGQAVGYRSAWIDVARVLACYLIVCVHTPGYPAWGYEWSLDGRNALFFMLAGYFCRFDLTYRKMFHKALWLLIPLLAWNVITVYSGLGESNEISLKSLTGLGGFSPFPADGPLWFLFYIVLFTLFVPCLRLTVDYKWIVMGILLILNVAEQKIAGKQSIDFFIQGLLPFYMGLYFSSYKLEKLEKKFILHRRYLVVLLVSLIIWLSLDFSRGYLQSLFGMFTIIAISALMDERFKTVSGFLSKRIAPASFLVFAVHVPVLSYLFSYSDMQTGTLLTWALPVLIIAAVAIIYNFFNAVFPPLLMVLAHKVPALKSRGNPPTRKWDLVFTAAFFCFMFPLMYYTSYACSILTYNGGEEGKENTVYINKDVLNDALFSRGAGEPEFYIKPFEGDTTVKFSFIADSDIHLRVSYRDMDESYKGFKCAFFEYDSSMGARTFSLKFPEQKTDLMAIRLNMTFLNKEGKAVFLDAGTNSKTTERIMKTYNFVDQLEGYDFDNMGIETHEMANLQIISQDGDGISLKSLTNDPSINLARPVRTNSLGIVKIAVDYTSSKETYTEVFFAENKLFNGEQMMRFFCKNGRNRVILTIVGKPNTEYDLRFDPSVEPGVMTTIYSIGEVAETAEP